MHRRLHSRRGAALIFAVVVSMIVMMLAVAVSSLAYSGQDQSLLALHRTQAEAGAVAASDLALDWVRALPDAASDVSARLPEGAITGSLDGSCYGFTLAPVSQGRVRAEAWALAPAPPSGCPTSLAGSQAASVGAILTGPEDDPSGWQRAATEIP